MGLKYFIGAVYLNLLPTFLLNLTFHRIVIFIHSWLIYSTLMMLNRLHTRVLMPFSLHWSFLRAFDVKLLHSQSFRHFNGYHSIQFAEIIIFKWLRSDLIGTTIVLDFDGVCLSFLRNNIFLVNAIKILTGILGIFLFQIVVIEYLLHFVELNLMKIGSLHAGLFIFVMMFKIRRKILLVWKINQPL